MPDVNCQMPPMPTPADAGRAYRQARQKLKGLGPDAYKREAARSLGIDYDHYNALYKQAISKTKAPVKPSPVSKPVRAITKSPEVKPVSKVEWTRGSDALRRQMEAAESQRQSLEKARYIQKGKGKGTLNAKNGYTPERASARQMYTEVMNSEMNALKRDPAAFAAKNSDRAIKYTSEQSRLVEELFERNALTDDIAVGRAMTGDFGRLRVGDYMADPGFLSTTTDLQAFLAEPSGAYRAGVEAGKKEWTFIIQVPNGTPALPGAGYQKEIFFRPGTKQRIIDIDKSTRTVYTRVVK